MTLFALGTVFEKLRPTHKTEVHRVSLATGKFIDCDGNGINCADESAADMNIKIIPNAAELSPKEWSIALIGAV